jgi:Ca2+-dependent lipid-binding protein
MFPLQKLKRPRDSTDPYSISKLLNATGSFRNTLDFIFHVMDSSNIEYSCSVHNREQSKENVRIIRKSEFHRCYPNTHHSDTYIVTVCVFVRHLFSFYPFYFDFHSARIIFDMSSGFYLWNINNTTA